MSSTGHVLSLGFRARAEDRELVELLVETMAVIDDEDTINTRQATGSLRCQEGGHLDALYWQMLISLRSYATNEDVTCRVVWRSCTSELVTGVLQDFKMI